VEATQKLLNIAEVKHTEENVYETKHRYNTDAI
jgi:hypothetical protein